MELARIHKKDIGSRSADERELMSSDESDDDAFRFQLAAVNATLLSIRCLLRLAE